MAKRRTKKQKQKSLKRRVAKPATSRRTVVAVKKKQKVDITSNTDQSDNSSLARRLKLSKKLPSKEEKSLLRVDVKYLKTDLLRSLIITCILVASLIGIYLYMSYN